MVLTAACLFISQCLPAQTLSQEQQQFISSWQAASRGDHTAFLNRRQGLEQYILFPYLQYEDLRNRRAKVSPAEMASFLDQHQDWAFTGGLRTAWLKTLGRQGRWEALLIHGAGSRDTVVRCYHARARIRAGKLEGVMAEAQELWTAPGSQPKECNPLFDWLRANSGITPGLAWRRIRLAMQAGNPRLTLYLARYVPAQDRQWLERWQDLNRSRYRNLGVARNWRDEELSRMITSVSVQRLARRDATRAWKVFQQLDGRFKWSESQRHAALREIALQAAVELAPEALDIMATLPAGALDDQVLQWWARSAMVGGHWQVLADVISRMPPETRADARWRYWMAAAREQLGDAQRASQIREALAREANYYGFLSADKLDLPYSICPLEPAVSKADVNTLRAREDFGRALELRAISLDNWAAAEWSLAAGRLDKNGLRAAAALAFDEGWYDRAIFSLGDSGDLRYYAWRFPLLWQQQVAAESSRNGIDPAWIHGVMRSESALVETARSSAGALGLMQITPATAQQLSRRHGLAYRGSEQLKEADTNIRFGTRFMRDLMDRFNQNPVLVSGAYNAGPEAVDRWLSTRPRVNADIWVESIPYFETRDYIPRVLAFTAIYDWRMQNPVTRVSSRMPKLDSGTIQPAETTGVVCSMKTEERQAG
ncbi:MAG: transglycosylase SLT domain-containing protein [Gammaproteobacteria bacterium]|nr:transglycosylase SLT domain-containing protein [Gammaproteobacteria bacterium]